MQLRKEAKPKERTLINRRKYYGVGVEISDYKREIIDTFYDEELVDKIFNRTEDLDFVRDYFYALNNKISGLLDKVRKIFSSAFEKGSRRVVNNKGDIVKFGEVKDKSAIDILVNQQTAYYKNLTEEQSRAVNKIIARGLDKGKSYKEIAGEIKAKVKRLTYVRALTIAKTEVVKSHNLGQVETMRSAGVKYYNYITANDNKVSEICKKNQGPKGREKKYDLALAGTKENPLPVVNSHPSCRCCIVVYTK